MTLQEQAWASVSPGNVLKELQSKHQLKVDGDKLIVSPPPGERLTFQIRRYKQKLLELMGAGKTLAERITEAQEQLGWKVNKPSITTPSTKLGETNLAEPNEGEEERLSIVTEGSYKGKAITFDPAELETPVEAPWPAPVIDRSIQQHYCQHKAAGEYRRKVDDTVVVQLLCPECGHNLKGPRRNKPYLKRTNIPWWPKDSQVIPDPDAPTDELVEWWATVEPAVTDGSIFSPGVTVANAKGFKASINELIGLWRLGEPDIGLSAQLTAHRTYLKQLEASKP